MKHFHERPHDGANPSTCSHGRVYRVGIQRFPMPPFRLYLVTCVHCGTTVTTKSLREFLERNGTPPRRRRPAA